MVRTYALKRSLTAYHVNIERPTVSPFGESGMKTAILWALSFAASAGLSCSCLAESLSIERQVTLSAPRPIKADSIMRANEGDPLILSTDDVGSRAWAT